MTTDRTKETKLNLKLTPINQLKKHEQHDQFNARKLAQSIHKSNIWKVPIVAEMKDSIILDGHHRLAAARILNLNLIPTFVVNYQDELIDVSSWRPDIKVDRLSVIEAANGDLLPIKTSRHNFGWNFCHTEIPLDLLRKSDFSILLGKPQYERENFGII